MEHRIVLANTSKKAIDLADTRTSHFAGPGDTKRLVFTDEGCFPAPSPLEPGELTAVCQDYQDALVIPAGESISRTITLYQGLDEMDPLVRGVYVFPRPLEFESPRPKAARGAIKLVYRIAER